MDAPESIGALTLAAREKLDNLTFIIDCNLQDYEEALIRRFAATVDGEYNLRHFFESDPSAKRWWSICPLRISTH